MTDSTEILHNQAAQDQNIISNETTKAEVSQDTKPVESQRHERTYTRDELAKITSAESKKAYEKAKVEASREYEAKIAQQSVSQPTVPGITKEALETEIKNVAQKMAYDAALQQEANSFHSKIDIDNDVDMKLAYEKLRLGQMPMPHIHVLNSVDNPRDVLKEFAKFPEKLVNIMNTSNLFGLDAGKEAMQRVSESIKKNQAAAEVKTPSEPPSKIQSSSTASDNGLMTASDYRKQYKKMW